MNNMTDQKLLAIAMMPQTPPQELILQWKREAAAKYHSKCKDHHSTQREEFIVNKACGWQRQQSAELLRAEATDLPLLPDLEYLLKRLADRIEAGQ